MNSASSLHARCFGPEGPRHDALLRTAVAGENRVEKTSRHKAGLRPSQRDPPHKLLRWLVECFKGELRRCRRFLTN
jgi:hypothetical protein